MSDLDNLKKTPLYGEHQKLGARLVEFGGWAMPVQYSGVIAEHTAVRTRAGLFDVSHMGEFRVEGPEAMAAINHIVTNDVSKLAIGQAMYGIVCFENGTVVDDVLVYRLGPERYWVVVNAGNIDKDWDWFVQHTEGYDCELENISYAIAEVALQGPLAERVLQRMTDANLAEIKLFWSKERVSVAGIQTLLISRTGYTGEDGFEIYCNSEDAPALWEAILEEGEEDGVEPAGLGARDTLRFEARLPLYGHEISDQISPLEAGLGRWVKLDKAEFIGKEALARQKEQGLGRKLVGFELIERGVPRGGYPIAIGGREVGFVTTGTASPTVGKMIGLGYVPTESSALGTEIDVIIRGNPVKARIVETPFYKRAK